MEDKDLKKDLKKLMDLFGGESEAQQQTEKTAIQMMYGVDPAYRHAMAAFTRNFVVAAFSDRLDMLMAAYSKATELVLCNDCDNCPKQMMLDNLVKNLNLDLELPNCVDKLSKSGKKGGEHGKKKRTQSKSKADGMSDGTD